VLQVADIVLQGIEAPAWVMKVFMLVLALGFPFVLLVSWAYELTPEGLKKEKDVERTVMRPEPAPATTAPVAEVAEKSIAVLAFEDLSPEGDQEYIPELV
jgi:hypothetical protein